MTTRIKLRRDIETNWNNANPILALGEPGYDITNNKLKVGDGVTAWMDLDYLTDNTGGGGGSLSIRPDIVTYQVSGTFYGKNDPGFTLVDGLNDDDEQWTIPLPTGKTVTFLGQVYNSEEIHLVSNSYIYFAPSNETVTEYYLLGPGTNNVPFPAVFMGAADYSLQKYYYGIANGTDTFVIGYEGSSDTSGTEGSPAVVWEFQFNLSGATATSFNIVFNDQQTTFPAGAWGVSNGTDWVDMINPLPWKAYNRVSDQMDTFNVAIIGPIDAPDITAGTIAFTGPGVNTYEEQDVTYINIDPFDGKINVGMDSSDTAVISARNYGLLLTTARANDDVVVQPGERGAAIIKGGHASANQQGTGGNAYLEGGNAYNTQGPSEGGYVYIRPGNGDNGGNEGQLLVQFDNHEWRFKPDGTLQLPILDNDGYQPFYNLNGATLKLGGESDPNDQIIITGPEPTSQQPNAQRIVIQGQKGFGNESVAGEGGDVYIWGGTGGEGQNPGLPGGGGDIKLRGGAGQAGGDGGYIRIEGGDTFYGPGGTGGFVEINAGEAVDGSNGDGGDIRIKAGRGTYGGNNGEVHVYTSSNGSNFDNHWIFKNDGSLALPDSGKIVSTNAVKGWSVLEGVFPNEESDVYYQGVTTDSNGNVYALGGYYWDQDQIFITKYNSDGEKQWQKFIWSGDGASFDVSTNNDGIYVVSVNLAGQGYGVNDKIYIPGNSVGGINSINGIEITVTEVNGTGGIVNITHTGTANISVSNNWVIQDPYDSAAGYPSSIVYNTVTNHLYVTATRFTYQANGYDNNWTNLNIYKLDLTGALIETTSLIEEGDIIPNHITVNNTGTVLVSAAKYADYDIYGAITVSRSGNGYIEFDRSQFTGHSVLPGDGTQDLNNYWLSGTGISAQEQPDDSNLYENVTATIRVPDISSFNISISTGTYVVDSVVSGGANYSVGHKVKILGSDLGGSSPTDDLILQVSTVDTGTITTVSIVSGTPNIAAVGPYNGVTATPYDLGSGAVYTIDWGFGSTPVLSMSGSNGGTNYVVGDVLTIPGTTFAGGDVGSGDISITVDNVGISGNQVNFTPTVTGSINWDYQRFNLTGVDFSVVGAWSLKRDLSQQGLLYTNAFTKSFGEGGNENLIHSVWDSTGDNIYSVGSGRFGTNYDRAIVTKWSADGTLLWTKAINYQTQTAYLTSVAVSDSYIYAAGVQYDTDVNGGSSVPTLTKLSASTGDIVWQKKIYVTSDPTQSDEPQIVVVNNEIYMMWLNDLNETNTYGLMLVKLNSDGATLWHKSIVNYTDSYWYWYSGSGTITTDGTYLYIAGTTYLPTYSYANGFVIKITLDGGPVEHHGAWRTLITSSGVTNTTVESPTAATITTTEITSPTLTVETDNLNYQSVSVTDPTLGTFGYNLQTLTEKIVDHDYNAAIVFSDGSEQKTSSEGVPQIRPMYDYYYVKPSDNGKHIYFGYNEYATVYIPHATVVELPVGFKFTIINRTGGSVYLYCDFNGDATYSRGNIYGAGLNIDTHGWYISDSGSGTMVEVIKVEDYTDTYNGHEDRWILNTNNTGNVGID